MNQGPNNIIQDPTELLKELSFCVFDLETTGGNHKLDKIIEIGLVKIENLEIVGHKTFLIQPEIKIPEFIQKLTAITPADVKDSPLIDEVIDEIIEFMGSSVLVAHNTAFDIPFLNSVLRRLDKAELENRSICTNLMTKYLIPNLLNSNLNYMSKIFNIPHQKAHRALDDAKASAHLLLTYLNIFINKRIRKINHLYYPRNRFELDRKHFKNNEDEFSSVEETLNSMHSPFLVTLKGENGVILFSLPCHNTKEEKDFFIENAKNYDWKTITIRLFGPFIESYIHFANLFNKIEQNTRTRIMGFLYETNLNLSKIPIINNDGSFEQNPNLKMGDFIICNHLVPDQMIIFPFRSLHQKSQLIFRYPGHQKKLIQYINSKANRITNNKLKATHFNPILQDFLNKYLLKKKEEKKEVYVFQKELPTKNPDGFLDKLKDFSAKNPNSHSYPKTYI